MAADAEAVHPAGDAATGRSAIGGPPIRPAERFAQPVVGPSYKLGARVLAIVLTAIVVLFIGGALLNAPDANASVFMLLGGAGIAMVVTCGYIVAGKTTVDARGVRQDWLITKDYAWEEIQSARVLRLPLATRLLMVTARPPYKTVHAGSPELRAAFEEIATMLSNRR